MRCYLPWNLLFPSLNWEEHCSLVVNGPFPAGTVPFSTYLATFAITLLLEALVIWFFWRKSMKPLAVFVANLITHPLAVFVWVPFAAQTLRLSAREVIVSAELVIPMIEFFVYLAFGYRSWARTLLAAYLANLASWSLVALMQVYGLF